jgi:hypothetical protein
MTWNMKEPRKQLEIKRFARKIAKKNGIHFTPKGGGAKEEAAMRCGAN